MIDIPTIDLNKIDKESLAVIDRACQEHGFFKVSGHGLNDDIDEMFESIQAFFATPREVKRSVYRGAGQAFGYYDKELTKQKRDLKEVFDYHGQEGTVLLGSDQSSGFWPSQADCQNAEFGLSNFEAILKRFYGQQTLLAERITQLLSQALGQDAGALDDLFGDKHTSTARLNHYPGKEILPASEQDASVELNELALGEHTDPNGVTVLYQDSVGGLQAYSNTAGWIDVPPEPYTFVINIGDIMQAWSNDRYKAALHRVRKIPSSTPRISFTLFHMPKNGTTIESIVGEDDRKFRSFDWNDFINARISDNYVKQDDADMQLDNYRTK